MSALELITDLYEALFALIFVAVVVNAFRERTRGALDVALFFAVLTVVALQAPVLRLLGAAPRPELGVVTTVLAMLLPFLMFRLLTDFAPVPLLARAATAGGLLAAVVVVIVGEGQATDPATSLYLVAYFAAVSAYAALGFGRLAGRSTGVTRRRTQAVSAGNAFLALAVALAGVGLLVPAATDLTGALTQLAALGAAVAWAVGFSPPVQLRRYWGDPELRRFLERAGALARLPTTAVVVRELERLISAAVGARAAVGVFDPDARLLNFAQAVLGRVPVASPFLAARVFASQRAEFFPEAARANPEAAAAYRAARIGPVLIAPITAGERRIGVLEAFAEHRPIFTADDLELVRLLADQAAIVLESRSLIDEAARVRAQEQAARLKEDFVSAAAHDLKTPLTTLLGQAQILERRFERDPALAMHLGGVQRIAREARRLSALVEDLLDASRIDQGRLELRRERTDLGAVLREVAARARPPGRVAVEAQGMLVGAFDRRRIEQLVGNLVENGLKYSPADATVEVRAWREPTGVRIAVRDHGIGIPTDDLPRVFDRFHRAANVDSRRFAGIGLGLYICRGIAEEHGGKIWVESTVGSGSEFHVVLPDEGKGKLD